MSFYKKIQPWFIWFLAASFFFCEYFARVDAGVMLDQLMQTFHVSAFAIGNLGAFFYYPYIIMQIPVGLLVDRFGPRRWLAGAAMVSAIGSVFFAVAHVFYLAQLGRFLIGLGAAFAFVSAVKLATIWFDHKRLGLLVGLTQGAGMLGAALGSGFFATLVEILGWRGAMNLVSLVLAVFSILIFLFVKDKRSSLLGHVVSIDQASLPFLDGLFIVLRSKQSWCNALYAGFLYAPTAALGEFWGVSFFRHIDALSLQYAGLLMGAIFIGWALGGPLIGACSDQLKSRKPLMFVSVLMSLLLLCVLLLVAHLSFYLLLILMFSYGFFNTGVAIAYAVAGEIHDLSVVGMSVAFTNMVSILIGALLQPVIGLLLDHYWKGGMLHGFKVYPVSAYYHVLLMLPVTLLVSLLFLFFIKESYRVNYND